MSTVAHFLRYDPDVRTVPGMSRTQLARLNKKLEVRAAHSKEMKRAAFKVFSSLGANDEDIDTEPLMDCLTSSLEDQMSPLTVTIRPAPEVTHCQSQLKIRCHIPRSFQDHVPGPLSV